MEITGIVQKIYDTEIVGQKEFRKRNIIIKTKEEYPQVLCIQFVQDKVTLLDTFNVGDTIQTSVNVRGSEWVNPQGKTVYFTTLNGWKISNAIFATVSNAQQNGDREFVPEVEF